MATKTVNAYTPKTATEVSTANLGFLTTASSMKVFSNNCDDDQHPEMEIQLLCR